MIEQSRRSGHRWGLFRALRWLRDFATVVSVFREIQ
jgi:hypothetical protein